MKNRLQLPSSQNCAKFLPKLFFLFSVIVSIATTYYATGHFLDSDASSELVLARQLYESGKIISADWFYSTELRVLNAQLVYSPMFRIFSDWHLIRFFSALTLQVAYILAYGFMLHQGGFKQNDFCISAPLLLLPVSVAYGRIVLYHCHYITHIILSFFLMGLLLGFARDTALSPVQSILRIGMILIASFIGGLGGIRHLMIIHTPMILLILLICLMEDLQNKDSGKAALFSRQKILLISVAACGLLAAFIGYKINTDVFPDYFIFRSYSETNLTSPAIAHLSEILYGFLHQFGFRKDLPVLSLLGILSLGGILSAVFCLYLSARIILSFKAGDDLRKTMVFLFFLCYLVVMTTVFLITKDLFDYYYPLYYVICLSWAAPLLLSIPKFFPRDVHPFNFKRIFSWAAVVLLFANGFANMAFFNGVEAFDQLYEGLTFQEKDKVAQLTPVVDYLLENKYDYGYGTYWESNITTELTDGKIPMFNIFMVTDEDGTSHVSYFNWLTSVWQREAPKEKPFVLVSAKEQKHFEKTVNYPYCTCVYSDAFHYVYNIDNQEEFFKTLGY